MPQHAQRAAAVSHWWHTNQSWLIENVVSRLVLLLCSGVMFGDQPVQSEEKIFGGRYSDIKIECDPPQKV
jgi:hypothetical protein